MATRVAFVGAGSIAFHHAECIRQLKSDISLAAICDTDPQALKKFTDTFGVQGFLSIEEMFDSTDGVKEIDLVTVMTPTSSHLSIVEKILALIIVDIAIEKPLFLSVDDFDRARRLMQKYEIRLYPIYQHRLNLVPNKLFQMIHSGVTDSPSTGILSVPLCRPQRYYDLAQWRGTYAHDGGVVCNQAIHQLDLLLSIIPRVESVVAITKTLAVDIEVEDTISATLFTSNGIFCFYASTAFRPTDLIPRMSLTVGEDQIELYGFGMEKSTTGSELGKILSEFNEDFSSSHYGWGHLEIYRSIIENKISNKPYPLSFSESERLMRVIHALYLSGEQGGVRVDVMTANYFKLGKINEK